MPCVLPSSYYEQLRRNQILLDDNGPQPPSYSSPRLSNSRKLARADTWHAGEPAATTSLTDFLGFFCAADPHDEQYYIDTDGYREANDDCFCSADCQEEGWDDI